ncbi:MAG: phosphatidate cytidylyltransferase [Bacteroidetes bacterium]|nr:phosphatidate cytidylyltransferase [Bacteroidota bacterium]
MALNLKTLGTRSLSAAIFVVLLVGCVLWNYYSFAIFFFVVSLLGLNEFYKISEKLGAKPFKTIGFISAVLIYLSFFTPLLEIPGPIDLKKTATAFMVIAPFLILTRALYSKQPNSVNNGLYTIGGIIYAVLPFAFLNQTVLYGNGCIGEIFSPWLILGVIFLIWSNDTFAYLGGSLFGKNKMIERVSPGKTWEGTAIGMLLTFALSFTFNTFVYRLDSFMWPLLGVLVPVLSTIGDLVESKLKREAGIKDSGNIMPGHGGILDRFDSLIFVSPFIFVLFKF